MPLWFVALTLLLAGAERPPNIVLIVADDLGWADVGYHDPQIRSPNIDRLAAAGAKLECHYVMPQCTPTRVALLTGRYPSRFGNHCTQASNEKALPDGTPTLASLLKDAGYDTGLFGKWHLGSKPEWGPNHFGFQHSYGSLAGAVGMYDHRYRLTQPEFTQTWHRNHEFLENEEGHATDLVTEEAIRWLKRDRQGRFFLYLPYQSVHVPLVEEEQWLKANAHIKDADRRLFAAAVTHLDACIGQVIVALEETGHLEDTLVVFTSDNGGLHHHRGDTYPPPDPELHNFSSNKPLRGQKGETYEGGMRVPAFAYWKGRLPAQQIDTPLHAVDWLPTLCKLANAPIDSNVERDGSDIWPAIVDKNQDLGGRTFYWVWGNKRQRVALRHGPWKLVRNGPKAKKELFHLMDDPNETTDLAASKPEKLKELLEVFMSEKSKDAL